MVIIAIGLPITLFDKTVTPVYAIEQTIEAMKNITTVHLFARDWQDRELEIWIKVNPETGENDCHYANEPERGQISISTPEITYFYQPNENKVRIIEGQAMWSDIRNGRFIEDVLDKMIKPHDGQIQINREYDSVTKQDVMVLFAKSPKYDMEAFIDPETNLPIRINFGKASSGQVIKNIDEIYYNETLPEGLFDFEIPEDAQVIREISLSVLNDPSYGISAEGLSEDQACIKILQEFWAAVINKDFERAHLLLPAASVEKIQEVFTDIEELISIGEPFEVSGISGILTPVRIRFSDERVLELYQITYFRIIDGEPSCVLAGQGQPSKWIE
jgi:hypothetical protein